MASIVPWLVRVRKLLPIFPAPGIVSWLMKSSDPVEAPYIKFWELSDRVSVPVPFRVTDVPLISRLVALPAESNCIAPLLVIVPTRVVLLLLGTCSVPELVNPFRVVPPKELMTPPAEVVRVPPVTEAPFKSTVDPYLFPCIVPPVLAIASRRSSVPPLVASIVPVLVVPPLACTMRGVGWLASMVP